MDLSLLNLLQSQKKNVPPPAPPELLGHPRQINTNLSKVVRVLLVVGAILRRTEVIQNQGDMGVRGGRRKGTLTMLLWWALVISSILPTRSVVDTPCVLLHSLRRDRALPLSQGVLGGSLFCSPVSPRRLHLFVGVFAVHRERYII